MACSPLLTTRYGVTDCDAAAARRLAFLALDFGFGFATFLAAFRAAGRADLRPVLFLALLAVDFLAMVFPLSMVKGMLNSNPEWSQAQVLNH